MGVGTYAWAGTGSAIVTVVGFAGCGISFTGGGATTNGSGGSPSHSGATVAVASSSASASSGSGGTRSATTTSATTTSASGGGATSATTSSGGGGATTTSTSSGNGGATSATTTSTSSGGGGATSASSASSSSGGTTCDQACAHVATCPGFTCSKILIDCSTSSDCVNSCIASTPCSQVGFETFQTCQAQCSGDGGPPPMDAGPALDCNQCASYMCTNQEFACDGNTACQPWGLCALACIQQSQPTPGCLAACDAKYPAAEPTFDPLYTCICAGCSTECASIDPCAHGMDGGP